MKTWSGSDAPLTSGEPNILDLVVHLGRERRWGGFGSREWTVLHHSFLCTLIWLKAGFPPEGVYAPLLHDGHEYITGDIPSPVKALLGPEVKKLERDIDHRIASSLGLNDLSPVGDWARQVRICDLVALVIEAPLFGPPGAGKPCEHSATVDNLPEEFREEVAAVLKKVMPDFARVLRNRGAL